MDTVRKPCKNCDRHDVVHTTELTLVEVDGEKEMRRAYECTWCKTRTVKPIHRTIKETHG